MLGIGLGALAGGRLADRWPSRLVAIFAVCELGIGLFGLVSEPLIRSVASATVTSPRATVATVNFALLLVPTSLMGATLPLLVTHATLRTRSVGTSIGRLYFANTLGAAVAAILAVFGFGALDVRTLIWVARPSISSSPQPSQYRSRAVMARSFCLPAFGWSWLPEPQGRSCLSES
jgi:MFS family permease